MSQKLCLSCHVLLHVLSRSSYSPLTCLQIGLNGVDNGAIRFTHVRVPRVNLLDRFASVDKSGRYSSPLTSQARRCGQSHASLGSHTTSHSSPPISVACFGSVPSGVNHLVVSRVCMHGPRSGVRQDVAHSGFLARGARGEADKFLTQGLAKANWVVVDGWMTIVNVQA